MKIEVSIGEIVDKLTILQIKKNNILDLKNNTVNLWAEGNSSFVSRKTGGSSVINTTSTGGITSTISNLNSNNITIIHNLS